MRFLLALIYFAASLSYPAVAQEKMLPYFDGIPVMNGFMMATDDVTVFDKPEGRIVEAFIWCEASCPTESAVKTYYAKALSGLGWARQNNGIFAKSPRYVQFDIYRDPETTGTVVHFRSFEKST